MAIVLSNALLVDLDPPRLEAGAIRIDSGKIVARAASITPAEGDEVVNCFGTVVMPGLVNGHTHLYSALAVGMPPPPKAPTNFLEILKFVWWRLDQALDAESIEVSARIGAIEALKCGTTTLIDHHASPLAIEGSLELVRKGVSTVGLRGVLCYETTDRHGPAQAAAGIEENERFLAACADRKDGLFAGLVGGHAAFTLEDERLDRLAALAEQYKSGVHLHVAEDGCDEDACREKYKISLIERLEKHGLVKAGSVFAHGTHLSKEAVEKVNAAGLTIAHNPRSNMHNAVGYAPVAAFKCPVMLGTDGIGGDMLAEARGAWFVSRHEHAGVSPDRIIGMLVAGARRASAALGVTLGKLEVGAAADVVVTDYVPSTPMTAENLAGHLIFGIGSQHVRSVLVSGRWEILDRKLMAVEEGDVRGEAAGVAKGLWERMGSVALE